MVTLALAMCLLCASTTIPSSVPTGTAIFCCAAAERAAIASIPTTAIIGFFMFASPPSKTLVTLLLCRLRRQLQLHFCLLSYFHFDVVLPVSPGAAVIRAHVVVTVLELRKKEAAVSVSDRRLGHCAICSLRSDAGARDGLPAGPDHSAGQRSDALRTGGDCKREHCNQKKNHNRSLHRTLLGKRCNNFRLLGAAVRGCQAHVVLEERL